MLIGFFVGSVFFVRLGDIVGRKPIVVSSTIISTLSLIGCQYLAPTITALLIFIFIFGVTVGPRCFLSYVLAMELTPKEHHTLYAMLAMLFDSLCMIFLGFFFWAVRSMQGILTILMVLQVFIILGIWFFVPESPKFLYEQGRKEAFTKALKMIARVNGKDSADATINIEEVRNFGAGGEFTERKKSLEDAEGGKEDNFGTINEE
jgi:MFS family permease